MMRQCLLLLGAIGCFGSIMKYELENNYESVADPNAVVTLGNARFTVLTPFMVRMEYSENGQFEDRPSLAVVNRKLSVPQFTKNVMQDRVNITTSALTLLYVKGSGDFSTGSLKVNPRGTSTFQPWSYGMTSETDKENNLMGTFRTLDQINNVTLDCSVNNQDHCEWGLISRSGWALIDDANVPVMDTDDWWTDSTGTMLRNVDKQDLYLLAYSDNYLAALGDYAKIGGRIPIFPRQNHGVWFTRWYNYANLDVRHVVEQYDYHNLPLDVMVLDMNWHTKNDWTGYSWDRNLYPVPSDLMAYLHVRGIRTSANLHDATGIGKWEEKYEAACRALGYDPSNPPGPQGIPFDLSNKSYVQVLEDIVVGAVEKDGMDMWWIDWQQGETKGHTGQDGPRHKMNPTIWTDKMRVTDSKRRCLQSGDCTNKRGVVHARWGGLGNHRYQHGFSGDVKELTWFNMAYQTYFSATASNVLYGWWSHDIVAPGGDHEMLTRWIQLGVYSGIMRSHDRGMSAGGCKSFPTKTTDCANVRPWNVPFAFEDANRKALRRRAELLPYIYTHTRIAFETGVGLLRPMYYHFPKEMAAYPPSKNANLGQNPGTNQYFFGEKMLLAPIVSPAPRPAGTRNDILETPAGLVSQQIWLPPGKWVEETTGKVRSGGVTINPSFALWEVPVYVQAGAVVPTIAMRPGRSVGLASKQYEELIFNVYPGEMQGGFSVYEDDGETYAYLNGAFGHVDFSYTRTRDAKAANATVRLTGQGYPSRPPSNRWFEVRFHSAFPPIPSSVKDAMGRVLPYSRWANEKAHWTYRAEDMAVVVRFQGASVSLEFSTAGWDALQGVKGILQRAVSAKRVLDEARVTPGHTTPDPKGAPLSKLASLPDTLEYFAGANLSDFHQALQGIGTLHNSALSEIGSHNDARWKYAYDLLSI